MNPPTEQPHVTILGAGLIGLTSAMFLSERGLAVTVIDSGPLGGGASRGNAGYICTSIVGPLAGPGAVRNAIKSLANPESALRVHPTQVPKLAGWFMSFARSSTASRFRQAQLALGRLNLRTAALVDEMRASGARIDTGKSLLVAFHDQTLAEHYRRSLEPMRELGCIVPDQLCDGDEMRRLVPALTSFTTCGLDLPGERSIDPGDFVQSMIEALTARGVELIPNCSVTTLNTSNGRVCSLDSCVGIRQVDQVVLAAGAGSRRLGRLAGLKLPIISGQGYNVLLPATDRLTHPVICEEAHAVATPLPAGIRLGGTMEFGGDQPPFDQRRVDAIISSMRGYFDLEWDQQRQPWAGARPLSPDGMPLIGRPRALSNMVIAAGHGMYGLTLAPSTGKAVSELIIEGRSEIDLTPFDPNRFRL